VARREDKRGRISIFKGREAKLNRAIFHILALKGPLTIYDIHKEVKTRRRLRHTRYASVNKRVRSLEKSGYIKRIGVKKTKAGFRASIYELTAKAYLGILFDSINLEDLFMRVDEATASVILAAITYTSVNSSGTWRLKV
jgi:DNA-binding Lrp family transcriptional regulator